jgi:hypothetical protein
MIRVLRAAGTPAASAAVAQWFGASVSARATRRAGQTQPDDMTDGPGGACRRKGLVLQRVEQPRNVNGVHAVPNARIIHQGHADGRQGRGPQSPKSTQWRERSALRGRRVHLTHTGKAA